MNFKIYFGIFTILSTFSHGFSSELNGKPFQRVEIKSVKCKGLQDFYYPNMTCFAKPFNRTAYTYTIYLKYKKPLEDFYQQLFLEYRYGNIYREIAKSPKFNWCTVTNNTNPLVKVFYRSLKLSEGKKIKNCPIYQIDDKMVVISTDAFPDIFPRGDYRFLLEYFDKNDKSFLNVTFIATLRSSDIRTFG